MRVSVDKQDGEETGLRRGGKALEHMSQHRQSCLDPDRLITDSAHDLAKKPSPSCSTRFSSRCTKPNGT